MFDGIVVRTRLVLGKYKYCLAEMLFMFSLWIRWKLCSASWWLVQDCYILLDCLKQAAHVKGMVGTIVERYRAHRQNFSSSNLKSLM